ncbi:MAG: serine/threonine-protein kinase [bacterium]
MTADRAKSTPLGPVLHDGAREISFGKYVLIRKIAVGGMAEVYLAKSFGQFGFEKPVVIKVLLPKLSADEEFREMFVREALMAADFRHPRLCQVYDVGETAGLYYICMEFVDGVDLTRLVRRAQAIGEPMPLRIALKIARDLCEGLQYVHTAKTADGSPLHIVHRDVTPQNIMAGFDGHVKLVDFGVAKTSLAEELKRAALKGKGPYMAPEQWRGSELDGRADLFALGIVLYELTVGKRLFKRSSPDLVRRAILSGEISPPLLVRSDYPPQLEEVVLRTLELNPDDRFPTAAALGDRLNAVAVEEGLDASSDEMATYVCKLFAGVSRDEVFRPLELTAPGHAATAAAAAEREDSAASVETVSESTAEPRRSRLKRALWGVLGVAALGVAYGVGAAGWLHSTGPQRPAKAEAPDWRRPGVSAPSTEALMPTPLAPPAPPPALRGCVVSFASVSVDREGRVHAVDAEHLHLRCAKQPQANQDPKLRTLAAATLRSWRFHPVQFRGRAVATTTPLTVFFRP